MELTQLYYFKVVAEQQHFRKAAELLHITQPTLSQTISRLESELGCQLFDRIGRSASLNAYGREFYSHINDAIIQVEDGKRRILEMHNGNVGDIHIGITVPEMISDYLEPYLLHHSGIHIHQLYGSAKDFQSMLLDHTLDFAITIQPLETLEIQWEPIIVEEQGILVSSRHPLATRSSISLAELKNEKFIVNNANQDLRDQFQNYFIDAGYRPEIIFEGEQAALIKTLVTQNRGVSLCSKRRFNYHTALHENKDIVYLPIQEKRCTRTTGFAKLRLRPFSPCCETFYHYLKNVLQNEPEKI